MTRKYRTPCITFMLLPAMVLIVMTAPAMAELIVVCPPHDGDFPNEPVIEDTDNNKTSRIHNQQSRAIAVRACRECGNSVPEPGEQCDTGGESAGCDADCTFVSCGDGSVNETAGEQCDDGNVQSGDGCSASCTTEISAFCGDGVLNADEECDDGDNNDNDNCTNSCTNARCGDEIVWNDESGTEECDDGGVATAGCDVDCTTPACGDGVVNAAAGEECDDGNSNNDDACLNNCQIPQCTSSLQCLICEVCEAGECMRVPRGEDPFGQCSPYTCSGTNDGCSSGCQSPDDCAPGHVCAGGLCF